MVKSCLVVQYYEMQMILEEEKKKKSCLSLTSTLPPLKQEVFTSNNAQNHNYIHVLKDLTVAHVTSYYSSQAQHSQY